MSRAAPALIAAGGVAAALVVSLAIAIAIAGSLIPTQRVATIAAERAEALLGAPVRIGSASLRLFPVPTIRLTGSVVGADSGSTPVAEVATVRLRPRILPLFRRQVVIRSLALEQPRIRVAVNSTGRPNLPLLNGAGTAGASQPGSTRSHRVAFRIDAISVRDGRILYQDARDGADVRLEGWDQRLTLSGHHPDQGRAGTDLRGRVGFDRVDARLPGMLLPTRGLRLRIEYDARLRPDPHRLDLRRLQVALNRVTLVGSGAIDSAASTTGRTVRLSLAGDGLNAAMLLAWLPAVRHGITLSDGRRLELEGSANVRAAVAGPLTLDTRPGLSGTLTARDMSGRLGRERIAERIRVDAAFASDSVVARLRGRLLGERVQLGIAARSPQAPSVVLALSGRAELGRLAELGVIGDTLDLSGAMNVDLRTQLNLHDPATSRATGTLDLADVTVAGLDRLDSLVHVPHLALQFDGGRLRTDPARIYVGRDRTPMVLELAAHDWIPALLDPTAPPPRITTTIRADSVGGGGRR